MDSVQLTIIDLVPGINNCQLSIVKNYLLFLAEPDVPGVGLGFLLSLLGPLFLGGQHFDDILVLFRLTQGLHDGQRHTGIGDGGDGQLLPANGKANFGLGVGQADALLIGTGHEALGSAPGMIGSVLRYQHQMPHSGHG